MTFASFRLHRITVNSRSLLNLNKTVHLIPVWHCSVLSTERPYELGDFSKDLKPFLKNRKSRKYTSNTVPKNEHPIIKCKNRNLNHYGSQTYRNADTVPLASAHWRGHKAVGDYFTVNIYPEGCKAKYNNLTKTFNEIHLHPGITAVLKEHGITMMSEIQEKAIPYISAGKNCLIAAETGSGKTFAFMLPILQQIMRWKNEDKEIKYNTPYVIIITPNRELTEQIRDVVKWFKCINISSKQAVGGHARNKIQNPVVDQTDILVTTPGILTKFITTGIYSIDNVRHLVLDEADALLDDSFNELILGTLHKLKFRSDMADGVQLTLVGATLPTSLPDILGPVVNVDEIIKITTEGVHRAMPHVKQRFWRVSKSTKPAFLLQITKEEFGKKAPLIIFCESGIDNVNLSGDLNLRTRKGKFKKFQEGEESVLVCTDVAARGLDTKDVRHVLNYDFPLFIVEYIHRCGRTGRLGSKISGKVTNLISAKNEIALVQKIEIAVRCNTEFQNVNPNIKRIITFRNASPIEKTLGIE